MTVQRHDRAMCARLELMRKLVQIHARAPRLTLQNSVKVLDFFLFASAFLFVWNGAGSCCSLPWSFNIAATLPRLVAAAAKRTGEGSRGHLPE
jgi:hypothetical protein